MMNIKYDPTFSAYPNRKPQQQFYTGNKKTTKSKCNSCKSPWTRLDKKYSFCASHRLMGTPANSNWNIALILLWKKNCDKTQLVFVLIHFYKVTSKETKSLLRSLVTDSFLSQRFFLHVHPNKSPTGVEKFHDGSSEISLLACTFVTVGCVFGQFQLSVKSDCRVQSVIFPRVHFKQQWWHPIEVSFQTLRIRAVQILAYPALWPEYQWLISTYFNVFFIPLPDKKSKMI